jgi:hypothetical protein
MYGKDYMEHIPGDEPDGLKWMRDVAAGLGDVTSNERGTGVRYNDGKMRVDLMPYWIISAYEDEQFEGMLDPALDEALVILRHLGGWQSRTCGAAEVLSAMDDPWSAGAAVFEWGAQKYTDWNWAKGMPWSVPAACAVRHLLAILRGELNDPESGLPHIGHVASNLVMLAHYEVYYREGDDRPNIFTAADRPLVA